MKENSVDKFQNSRDIFVTIMTILITTGIGLSIYILVLSHICENYQMIWST